MTRIDHRPGCTCIGSGYATPTGHHPGCPEHDRFMRLHRSPSPACELRVGTPESQERFRSAAKAEFEARTRLQLQDWITKKNKAIEELITTLGPDPAADEGPGFPCTCFGRENGSPSGHRPGCPNHDHFLRWYRDRMTNVPQAADPRPGYASLSRVDAPYCITDAHGE